MWIEKPETIDDGQCEGGCTCIIRFSNPKIPSIKIDQCIGESPENLGDLNKNGTDEIGFTPGWFWSFWRSYHVWMFIKGKWIYAVEPFSVHDEQFIAGIKPIEKDYARDGFVIVRYSDSMENELVFRSKSVRIVK